MCPLSNGVSQPGRFAHTRDLINLALHATPRRQSSFESEVVSLKTSNCSPLLCSHPTTHLPTALRPQLRSSTNRSKPAISQPRDPRHMILDLYQTFAVPGSLLFGSYTSQKERTKERALGCPLAQEGLQQHMAGAYRPPNPCITFWVLSRAASVESV